MSKLVLTILLAGLIFCLSCASDSNQKKTPNNHSITIINFGGADTTINKVNTKGFGINNYTFIDLNTDSVFARQKYELEEPILIKIRTGNLKNLAKNYTILKGIDSLLKLPNGFIKGTKTKDNEVLIYCGPHAYLEHQIGNEKRYYFFTHHELDSTIENMSRLLLSLSFRGGLKDLNLKNEFNEDSILVPILSLEGMKNFNPPPIKSKIKFTPPVIKPDKYKL